jgi:hypothetical protein
MAFLVVKLLPPLLLTILIELSVGILLGYRKKVEMAAIVLVNMVTNPLLNYLVFLNNHFSFIALTQPIIGGLEFLVVLAEWGMLVFALHGKPKPLFGLSLAMNACSYIVGVWIYGAH